MFLSRIAKKCACWLHRDNRHAVGRTSLNETQIIDALCRLPYPPKCAVMVHSSLAACGYIEGGAPAVIRALRHWCSGASLAMPTHSYCYPDEAGACRIFDVRETPSLNGAITDAFWRQNDVRRSIHPTHSLACAGSDAGRIVANHENCDTPCGSGTPYELLIAKNAGTLMFGVKLNSYTFFHTAEDAAHVPYLYHDEPIQLKFRSADGHVRNYTMRRQNMRIRRRFTEMAIWLESRQLLFRQRCGDAELLWLPHSAAVHDAVTSAIRADPWMLVAATDHPAMTPNSNERHC